MTIKPIIAWYDLWIGVFIDRSKRRVYVFPLPCVGVVIQFSKSMLCSHEFLLDDLYSTGIEPPTPPADDAAYSDHVAYQRELYKGDHHTKRVAWPCRKCGKTFHARCGLDISPKHGRIVRGRKPKVETVGQQ